MTDDIRKPSEAMLDSWGESLRGQLDENIIQRLPVEERWVEDVRQYYGSNTSRNRLYTEKEDGAPVGPSPSPGFNRTRVKVNTGTGRISDLLFPGDDKNWAIAPSPVPELLKRMGDETPATHGGQEFKDAEGRTITEGDVAMREMEIAKEKAQRMEREIEDDLNRCHYGASARRAMFDAGLLGTGILKGPVVEGKIRKMWVQGQNGLELKMVVDRKPTVRRVSPWDFVPDMSAARIEQADFAFERVYTTKYKLRELAARAGFNQNNLDAVLKMTPGSTAVRATQSMNEMRMMSGLQPVSKDSRFELWLYHGPVSTDQLLQIGTVMPTDKADRLEAEYASVVWMCAGKIIKAAVSPLDTGELPYSLFAWEEDEACMFGFGIPYLTRNSQATIDTAWGSMLENAEKSAGPQIVYRKGIVRPVNGSHNLEAFKLWESDDKIGEARHAFQTYDIPNHQDKYAAIVKDASAAMDEESLIPVLAQGEQGVASDTLGGMAMLMNASLTTVRAAVKRWDDNVSVPLITRFYDWQMLNSKKEEIKGDFEVQATGTSSLLVREIVGSELRQILVESAANPALAAWTKTENLYKKYIATTHIKPEEAVRSEEEYRKWMQDQQEAQQNGPTPEQMAHEFNMASLEIKRSEQQVALMKMQSEERIALHKLRLEEKITVAEYQLEIEKLEKKERADLYKFQTEIKVKAAMGEGI